MHVDASRTGILVNTVDISRYCLWWVGLPTKVTALINKDSNTGLYLSGTKSLTTWTNH